MTEDEFLLEIQKAFNRGADSREHEVMFLKGMVTGLREINEQQQERIRYLEQQMGFRGLCQ